MKFTGMIALDLLCILCAALSVGIGCGLYLLVTGFMP